MHSRFDKPYPHLPAKCECGADPFLLVTPKLSGAKHFAVWCKACEREGPTRSRATDAIDDWNRACATTEDN